MATSANSSRKHNMTINHHQCVSKKHHDYILISDSSFWVAEIDWKQQSYRDSDQYSGQYLYLNITFYTGLKK